MEHFCGNADDAKAATTLSQSAYPNHLKSTTVSNPTKTTSRRRPGPLRHNSFSSTASTCGAPVAAGLARKSMGDIGSLAPIIRRRSMLMRELLDEHAVATSRLPSLMDIAYPVDEPSALTSRYPPVLGQQSQRIEKTKAATAKLFTCDDQVPNLGAVRNATRRVSRHPSSPLRHCNSLPIKRVTAVTVDSDPMASAMLRRSKSDIESKPPSIMRRRRSSLLRELVEEDVMSRFPSLMDIVYPERSSAPPPFLALKSNLTRSSSTFGQVLLRDEKAEASLCSTRSEQHQCCDDVTNTTSEGSGHRSTLRHKSFSSSKAVSADADGVPVALTMARRSMGDIESALIMRRRSPFLRELVEEDTVSRLPGLMDIAYPEESCAFPSAARKSRFRWISGRRMTPRDEKDKVVDTTESSKLFHVMHRIKFATRMAQTSIMSK